VAKLVQFDFPTFRKDVKRWLDEEGHGAGWRLIRASGISHGTYTRLIAGQTDVSDIDTILSILEVLKLELRNYTLKGGLIRGFQIDWKLFRECASFLCGGNARELHRKAGIGYQEAQVVLSHGMCQRSTMLAVCAAAKLVPAQLRVGWTLNQAR
jgi:hypothetical protein